MKHVRHYPWHFALILLGPLALFYMIWHSTLIGGKVKALLVFLLPCPALIITAALVTAFGPLRGPYVLVEDAVTLTPLGPGRYEMGIAGRGLRRRVRKGGLWFIGLARETQQALERLVRAKRLAPEDRIVIHSWLLAPSHASPAKAPGFLLRAILIFPYLWLTHWLITGKFLSRRRYRQALAPSAVETTVEEWLSTKRPWRLLYPQGGASL